MKSSLLTLQDCERKFDEKFYDINCPGFGDHTSECVKFGEIKVYIRSSFIQLLQSQIEEWKVMIWECPECKGEGYNVIADHGCSGDENRCATICPVQRQEPCGCLGVEDHNKVILSLINSNEEVILSLQKSK